MTLMTFSCKMCPKEDFLRSVLFKYKVTFIIIHLDFSAMPEHDKINLVTIFTFLVKLSKVNFHTSQPAYRV